MPRYPRNLGLASNQAIRYPGGRALRSDVDDAATRMAAERPAGSTAGLGRTTVQTQPDEWWRETSLGGGANAGGIIGSPAITEMIESGGGRSPSLINDPGLDWTGREPTVGEPTVETPTDTSAPLPEASLFPDITGRDVLPTGDTEWTATPEERRFLPTGASQLDLRSFGMNTGNNLSLGEFLNTPLSAMNYGEGYPPVQGGTVSYADTEYSVPGGEAAPDYANPAFTEAERRGIAENPDLYENSSGPAGGEFDAWPQAGRLEPNAPEGMTIVGHDETNGQPIYRDAAGNLHVNPGTGTPVNQTRWDPTRSEYVPANNATGAQFNNRAAGALIMGAQGMHQPVNSPGQGDERAPGGFGQVGQLNAQGQYEETGRFPRNFRSNLRGTSRFVYGAGARRDAGGNEGGG